MVFFRAGNAVVMNIFRIIGSLENLFQLVPIFLILS